MNFSDYKKSHKIPFLCNFPNKLSNDNQYMSEICLLYRYQRIKENFEIFEKNFIVFQNILHGDFTLLLDYEPIVEAILIEVSPNHDATIHLR